MAWHLTTVAWLGIAVLLAELANPAIDLRVALPALLMGVCLANAALSLAVTRKNTCSPGWARWSPPFWWRRE